MAIGVTDDKHFQDIADAIRQKNGSTETYKPNEMADAIKELDTFDFEYYGLTHDESIEINNCLNSMCTNTVEWNNKLSLQTDWQSLASFNTGILTADTSYPVNCREFLRGKIMLFVRDFNFENATNTYNIATNSKFYCPMPENWVFKKSSTLAGGFENCYFATMPEYLTIDVGNYEDAGTYISLHATFQGASSPSYIQKLTINGNRVSSTQNFLFVSGLKVYSLEIPNSENITTLSSIVNNSPRIIHTLIFGSVKKCTSFANFVDNQNSLVTLKMRDYTQGDLPLGTIPKLSKDSLKYIIWHASDAENGAVARNMVLQNATAFKVTWTSIKDTKPEIIDCDNLGITEEEISKYNDLTWNEIATLKLITVK